MIYATTLNILERVLVLLAKLKIPKSSKSLQVLFCSLLFLLVLFHVALFLVYFICVHVCMYVCLTVNSCSLEIHLKELGGGGD